MNVSHFHILCVPFPPICLPSGSCDLISSVCCSLFSFRSSRECRHRQKQGRRVAGLRHAARGGRSASGGAACGWRAKFGLTQRKDGFLSNSNLTQIEFKSNSNRTQIQLLSIVFRDFPQIFGIWLLILTAFLDYLWKKVKFRHSLLFSVCYFYWTFSFYIYSSDFRHKKWWSFSKNRDESYNIGDFRETFWNNYQHSL